jgi:hypothetical protein
MTYSLALQSDSYVISNAKGTKSFEGNSSQFLLHTPTKNLREVGAAGITESITQHGQYKPFMQAVLTGFVPVLTARQRENVEHNITGILAGMREESPGKIPSLYNKVSCKALCDAIIHAYAEKDDPKGVKLVYLQASRAFADKASRKAHTVENAYTIVLS